VIDFIRSARRDICPPGAGEDDDDEAEVKDAPFWKGLKPSQTSVPPPPDGPKSGAVGDGASGLSSSPSPSLAKATGARPPHPRRRFKRVADGPGHRDMEEENPPAVPTRPESRNIVEAGSEEGMAR